MRVIQLNINQICIRYPSVDWDEYNSFRFHFETIQILLNSVTIIMGQNFSLLILVRKCTILAVNE